MARAPRTPITPVTPSNPGSPGPSQVAPGQPLPPGALPALPQLTAAQIQRLTPQQRAQLQQLQQLHAQRAQAQQAMGPPQPDPIMQAALDASFRPVALKLTNEERSMIGCEVHGEETCAACGTDFKAVNELAALLMSHKDWPVPPPPTMLSPQRSQRVNKAKEDGNALFKKSQYALAIRSFTTAADFAAGRPPWESSAILRDELSMCLSNRSAAYTGAREFDNAAADADAVIALKRPWSKGHFRKAKALVGAGRLQEAKEAVLLGVQFDPNSAEMNNFLKDIERDLAAAKEAAP